MRIKKSPCGAGCGVIFLRYGVGMAAGERAGAQPPGCAPVPVPCSGPPKENRPGQRLPGADCYAEINR